MSAFPSVTEKRTSKLSPRSTLPGFTSPPILIRVPGTTRFSATSVGELKNTMESRNAASTIAAAMASTPKLVPIRTNRRCLRVIPSRSAFKPQTLVHIFDPTELIGIIGKCPSGIGGSCVRFVPVTEHHISAQQPLPAINVVSILLQPIRKAGDHAADHFSPILFAHGARRGNVFATWLRSRSYGLIVSYARKCVAYDRQPRRVSRRSADHIAPDSSRLRAITVLLSGHTHVKLCLGLARVERERTLECRLGI